MQNTTTTTDAQFREQMDELVQYLPMLRRLAAYEERSSQSIPEGLHDLRAAGYAAADALMHGEVEQLNPLPDAFKRPESETLLPGPARDLYLQSDAWLAFEEAHPEDAAEITSQRMGAVMAHRGPEAGR